MRKEILRGAGGILIVFGLVLCLGLPSWAMDKRVAENPLLYYQSYAKPATAVELTCDVGFVHNRITNSTVTKATGINEQSIIIGDDALELPSMRWLHPAIYADANDYLYFGSLRVGVGSRMVHFNTATSEGITTTSSNTDPNAISLFDTYFSISDALDDNPIGIEVHAHTYAWSEAYRDDFIIYDFWLLNTNDTPLDSVYVGWHADCDISAAGGGGGTEGFWRDDKPDYYRDDAAKEYISYMYDADNPTIAGDDTGGRRFPKESTGYIGTRLLYCPPRTGEAETEHTRQSGHGWWDWNSDPAIDDYVFLIRDGLWLSPPPSPHDFRYLQKLGPFDIGPNDSIRVVFAFGVGEGLEGLRTNLGWADSLFKKDWVGPSAPQSPVFTLTPGDRQVLIEWDDLAETTPDPATGQIDFEGYRVWRRIGESGTFTLLMEADLVNEIGHNTGLVHSYLDTDVSNGFQYSYVVTAYDRGDPENNIESLESGKGNAQTVEPGLTVLTPNELIHVVPNPFVKSSPPGFGFNPTNDNPSEERILFVNLPTGEVTVTVYSLTGDRIITLRKTDPDKRTVDWDLITRSRQKVVAGVYLYVVESPELGEEFIGKFMVVR